MAAMSFGRLVERLLAMVRSSGNTLITMPSTVCSIARRGWNDASGGRDTSRSYRSAAWRDRAYLQAMERREFIAWAFVAAPFDTGSPPGGD